MYIRYIWQGNQHKYTAYTYGSGQFYICRYMPLPHCVYVYICVSLCSFRCLCCSCVRCYMRTTANSHRSFCCLCCSRLCSKARMAKLHCEGSWLRMRYTTQVCNHASKGCERSVRKGGGCARCHGNYLYANAPRN